MAESSSVAEAAPAWADHLPPLGDEQRRAVCVHEAGHAVVHALGGATVTGIKVAPLGTRYWRTVDEEGRPMAGLWGRCAVRDEGHWLDVMTYTEDLGLAVDLGAWRARLATSEAIRPGSRSEHLRMVRASIAGDLAGPMAEALHLGEPFELEPESELGLSDENFAQAQALMLPNSASQLLHLQTLVADTLRAPDVWERVLQVADALESAGILDGEALRRLLPKQVPSWPPSARATKWPALQLVQGVQ